MIESMRYAVELAGFAGSWYLYLIVIANLIGGKESGAAEVLTLNISRH